MLVLVSGISKKLWVILTGKPRNPASIYWTLPCQEPSVVLAFRTMRIMLIGRNISEVVNAFTDADSFK